MFSDLNLTDMETCYKVFVRDVAMRLDIQSRDFGVEPEITQKVARMRARVYEVPISYHGRTYEEGKKIGLKDAFKAVYTILRFFRWEAPRQDVGAITLRRMANLAGYNAWLHKLFGPYLGRADLKVGSGVGNQTRFFLDLVEGSRGFGYRAALPDGAPGQVRRPRQRQGGRVSPAAFRRRTLRGLVRRPDTVVCLNVLEHVEDDAAAVRDFASVLAPGGRLVLLVPAMPALYGSLDVHLNHYRRYDPDRRRKLVSTAGFEIDTLRYLNRPGVAAWSFNRVASGGRSAPPGPGPSASSSLLRREVRRPPSFGMSLLVLARKT